MHAVCAEKYPRVNFCLFHGLCLNRFPTPDLRLQSVLDFLQVSCLAKTNKEVCYSGIRIGLGGQCEKQKGSLHIMQRVFSDRCFVQK